MKWIVLISLFAAPAFADTCPMVSPETPERSALMDLVRTAPDEGAAQALTNELWKIWAEAPDAHAQELLDEGMERRRSFDFDGAVIAFDALVGYCPDYAEGYNQRAFVAFLREDYATALEDLDRAIDLDPDHIAALSGKALSLMGLGRVKAARGVLDQALRLNPWLPERYLLNIEPGTDL